MQKGVACGGTVAPLTAFRGKLGSGGAHGFGGDRCNGQSDVTDAEREQRTVGTAGGFGFCRCLDAGKKIVRLPQKGRVER